VRLGSDKVKRMKPDSHIGLSAQMDERQGMLYSRLHRPPSGATVPGTLPVLFFGDLLGAEVATVGLNPSDQEYLAKDGALLAGPAQRFATLASLGAADRASLSDEQCAEAIEWMRDYYEPDKPVYGSWFNALSRVVEGFGASFRERSAVHLDLIQEATSPVWSELAKSEREALLEKDLPFLEWEIRAFPLTTVICTGKTASIHVRRQLGVVVEEEGTLARIKWWVGYADFSGRRVAFAGWNLPLARATGLGREGERALGELLAERLGRRRSSSQRATLCGPRRQSSRDRVGDSRSEAAPAARADQAPARGNEEAQAASEGEPSPAELFALVTERADSLRAYLEWARENDNEESSFRMRERPDIADAADAAGLFPEQWWGLVVFTCFGSTLGARTVAPRFQQPLPPPEAEAALAEIDLPRGSIGYHRIQPAHKGAKQALVAACADHELFDEVLHGGEDFDARYQRLRAERIRQWGRTTSFDLLLRAGVLGVGGEHYAPDYAYLAGSTGPKAGFTCVWGVALDGDASFAWAERLLRLWTEEWQAVAERVGVAWEKPPLEPCDQENFLCIYQERR
jgi:hypothetical protein